MFRKIVSNLAFSPALVGQLSFYAKRLKGEEATRRIGLMFTILALIVQSFAVFSPPESANAASSSDFIRGGVSSLNEYLSYYDRNTNNIRDIFNSIGITREEIASTRTGQINSKQGIISWGMMSQFSAAQGERVYNYSRSDGSVGTVYNRPLQLWDTKPYTIQNGSTYDAFIGYSKSFGWFALMKNCGNLATKQVPPPPPPPPRATPAALCSQIKVISIDRTLIQMNGQATVSGGASIRQYNFTVRDASGASVAERKVASGSQSVTAENLVLDKPGNYKAELSVDTSEGLKTAPACVQSFTVAPPATCAYTPTLPASSPMCQPCAGNSSIWMKDERCASKLVLTKTASNLTQGDVAAGGIMAMPSDRIAYQITVSNDGLAPVKAPLTEHLSDVLEYAKIIDSGGGTFNKDTQVLSWPDVTLAPGQHQSRLFVVQLASTIPATPQGKSNPSSYDCRMLNTFGNNVAINVSCPAPKIVEQTVAQLPHTGPTENMIAAGVIFATVAYFYARSRQLRTEVRLIRRDLNAGAI